MGEKNINFSSLVYFLSICVSLFHLYAAEVGTIFGMFQRIIHWMFMSILIFMLHPSIKGKKGIPLNIIFIFVTSLAGIYLLLNFEDIAFRLGNPTGFEIFLGIATILLVLEATRRVVGWPIVIVAILSISYAYFGYLLPGILGHRGYSLTRITSHLFLTTEGIYGVPLGASASFIILFIAYLIWILDYKTILCFPDSLLQGHSIWHLANAIVLYTFFLFIKKNS